MSLVENRKSKAEVEELFEIGIATLYRCLKNKGSGPDLRASKSVCFLYQHIHLI